MTQPAAPLSVAKKRIKKIEYCFKMNKTVKGEAK